MNILTSSLPKKIKIKDKIYDINYDYRTIIKILIAFEDVNLTDIEKMYILLKNLYKEDIPEEDTEEAIEKAIKFIDLGETDNNRSKKSNVRLYSFEKDGNYIFSGINSTHNIDIEKEQDLHWWKFMSYFMDMNPECMFGELTYYRTRKAEGKLTKDEKKKYEKIKDIIELENVKVQSEARKKFFEEYHKAQNK